MCGMPRKRKASVSIDPEIWQHIKRIHNGKLGRKLGARSPTSLIEKVLIAFIAGHDTNYAAYLAKVEALEKDLLTVDDNRVKGASHGDFDQA